MSFFGQKWKKTRMDSERKWKVCLMKVPLFLFKNALGPRYKAFYIFFVIPLRGHFRHASPAPISISFFCFFTNNQPHIYLIVRELFSKKFVFWHTLILSLSYLSSICVLVYILSMSYLSSMCVLVYVLSISHSVYLSIY